MTKFMVAVDGSENAKEAFLTVINTMNKQKDRVYLISVIQEWPFGIYSKWNPFGTEVDTQFEQLHKGILADYSRMCREAVS